MMYRFILKFISVGVWRSWLARTAGVRTEQPRWYNFVSLYINIGVWRSWLARTAGGREVAGSSPVTPTIYTFDNHKHLL